MEIFENIIDVIAENLDKIYLVGNGIKSFVFTVLSLLVIHNGFYIAVGIFFKRKFKPAENMHKYAILIPARNEEAVIGNLLDSIKRQDYPRELLTVFVVADNCTDNTAKVAREKGAVCYERFNDRDRTKGFALQFLFENIKKDYGIESFEGYFIFDADNLLNKDYISRMNDSFDAGEKIITSYRNTKNFDENWVASTYALHWLRSIRFRHRARSVFRLATNIQGTGFLFANELVKDGWKYTSLTEDRAFTADAVAHGYQITYNDDAMFYDEQPTSLRIALRQRTRWSKGHLMAFKETGWALFKNIFVGNCYRDKSERRRFTKESFIEGVRHRVASYDTLSQLCPAVIFKLFLWLLVTVLIYSLYVSTTGLENVILFKGNNALSKVLGVVFGDMYINAKPGVMAFMYSVALAVIWNLINKINFHFTNMLSAIYVFIVERKRIKKIPLHKKILYCFTWPSFDIIYRYSMYAALFMKVTWKPIPHTSKVTIEDIEK